MAGGAPGTRRLPRRGRSVALLSIAAFVVAAGSASLVTELQRPAPVDAGPGGTRPGRPPAHGQGIPGAGAYVPAYDLWSDPVFPTLEEGYAIERHITGAGPAEHLARSTDGGKRWYLVGAAFPFAAGYSEVQFISVRTGYAFGPAGLAVTHDGGSHWQVGATRTLGGPLQRVVPIGADVWATYVECNGPPVPRTECVVRLALSTDGGLHWRTAVSPAPLGEAYEGGDILARVTNDAAYVVSYGITGGGGVALTTDSGRSWRRLPDPCSAWRTVDMAALSGGELWMICGGSPVPGADASAKAVFRSHDGGKTWVPEAYTGFGPPTGPLASKGPIGALWYAGQLSQLATIAPDRAWIGVSGVGVLVSFDSGRTWALAKGMPGNGGDAGVGVTFNDAENGWAIEFRVGVWRTSDAFRWHLVDGG